MPQSWVFSTSGPESQSPFLGLVLRHAAAFAIVYLIHLTVFKGVVPWATSQPQRPTQPQAPPAFHGPSPADVIVVKAMLLKTRRLPPELIDIIVDLAEYWPCSRTSTKVGVIPGQRTISGTWNENQLIIRAPPIGLQRAPTDWNEYQRGDGDITMMGREYSQDDVTKILKASMPSESHPVRKVVFKITANDQGWGGLPPNRGTYRGSWTWFEAGLERYDAAENAPDNGAKSPATAFPNSARRFVQPRPVMPTHAEAQQEESDAEAAADVPDKPVLHFDLYPTDKYTIQRNVTASMEARHYEITWAAGDDLDPEIHGERLEDQGRGRASGDGEFVRSLRAGDIISIWGKARFPQWVNHWESVSIEVYWAM